MNQSSARNNFFQTDSCLDFYGSLSFVEPFCFKVERDGVEKGRMAGYLQSDGGPVKKWLSRRAIVNGGPAFADDITDDEVRSLLRKCREGLAGRAIYVETRNFDDYSRWKNVFEAEGFGYQPHYNFHVDTSSPETVEENLGKSRKRDIRTSLRDGASVIGNPTEAQVDEFYSVLERLYRTRVKTPLFPLEFFHRLASLPEGQFLLVSLNGGIIGGTACICSDDTVYEWFACGEDGAFKNIFPSTLATYAGIKFAAESGRTRFDMMGAGAPGDGGYGVRDFKARFGGQLVEHGRFVCVLDKPLFAVGKIGVKIMKKLK